MMFMICIIALITFSILGIFSAKYRGFAREAFRCVSRRVTLKPCDTSFDKKMKSKITGKLMKRSPRTAGVVYRHFDAISWVFTIILIVSLAYSTYSVYNLAIHGTCDPADPNGCLFNPNLPGCGDEACLHENGCQCDVPPGCDEPAYLQCGGDCSCIKEVCEG